MEITTKELSDKNSDVPSERQSHKSHSVITPAERLSKWETFDPPAKRNLCRDDSDEEYYDHIAEEHTERDDSDTPVEKYSGEHDSDLIVKVPLVEDTSDPPTIEHSNEHDADLHSEGDDSDSDFDPTTIKYSSKHDVDLPTKENMDGDHTDPTTVEHSNEYDADLPTKEYSDGDGFDLKTVDDADLPTKRHLDRNNSVPIIMKDSEKSYYDPPAKRQLEDNDSDPPAKRHLERANSYPSSCTLNIERVTDIMTSFNLAVQYGQIDSIDLLRKPHFEVSYKDIFTACANGNLRQMNALFKCGFPVNCINTDGSNLLHILAKTEHVKVLIEIAGRAPYLINARNNQHQTPLHIAAGNGNVAMVEKLLEPKAETDIVAQSKGTPLHVAAAAEGGNVDVIQEPISRKCDVDATDENNCTPLHSAAAKGKTEAAVELIKHGASKDIVAGTFGTPLHHAAGHGHLTTLRALLEHGCSLDTLATNGRTVLHHAAVGGNVAVIQQFISKRCDVGATDEKNCTPLHLAAAKGNTKAVVELIKHGASKDIVAGAFGTPLHQAAGHGHLTTLRVLLEHGCSLDTLATNGCTVLHHAALGGNVAVIQELISRKCNVDTTDEKNCTPLHLAAAKGKTEAVVELIKHGASKDIVAGAFGTPLHQAAVGGHLTTLRTLLEHGCSLDILATNGQTVLHHAASGGNVAVIQELISRKCDVDATDEDNWTPLHSAAAEGNTDAAVELIKLGARKDIVGGIFGTPLHQAAVCGHLKTLKAILEHGCSPDILAHNACFSCHIKNIETLSEYNHSVIHKRDTIGATPLHVAAQGNNPEIIRYLISLGLQVNSTDVYGLSSLHYAAGFGGLKSYQLLVDNGANEQCMATGFLTPLMFAQMKNNKRIIKYFENILQPLAEVKSQNIGTTIGASSLEYFFALNLISESDNDSHSITEECQQTVNLLKNNLSSVNIHNIIAIGALLGNDRLIDVIDTVLKSNRTVISNTIVSTITVDSVKWIFQLSKTEPILITTLKPGKTLSPLHLAMIAEKLFSRRSHLVLHMAPHNHLNFIKKLLSSPYLRRVYCGSQSSNWPIHPMHLADILQLHSFSDHLHEAGLEQFLLPLGATSLFTHDPNELLGHLCIALIENCPECGMFKQAPHKKLLMKHIVHKVQHRYDDDDLMKLVISLDIPLSGLSEAHAIPSKTLVGLLVFWLEKSNQPTWNQLLEVLDDFETANTMKTIKRELREELSRVEKQPHSNMTLERLDSSVVGPLSSQSAIRICQQCTSSYVLTDSVSHSYSNPICISIPQSVTLRSSPSKEHLVNTVIPQVCPEWYNFGLYLGMKTNILDGIKASRLPPFDCCSEVVKHWLQYICGSGQKQRSWNTVLVAVTKVSGSSQTEEILQSLGLQSYDEFTPAYSNDLNSVPELVLLVEFVVDRVKHKFRAFANSLGLPHSEMDSIRQGYFPNFATLL